MTLIDTGHLFSAGSESFSYCHCALKSDCIYTQLLVFEACDYFLVLLLTIIG